jgi:hypothetical protein
MLVRPSRKSFGILAVTRTADVSPWSRILTFIYIALLTRAHIRPHFNAIHFKAQA